MLSETIFSSIPIISHLSIAETIALSSVVIAISSFAVAFTHMLTARAHNRKATQPHLTFFTYVEADELAYIDVENCGLGPAFIEDAVLVFRGQIYKMERRNFTEINKSVFGEDRFHRWICHFYRGDCIRPGQSVRLANIGPSDNLERQIELRGIFLDIGYVIRYKSLYGNRYSAKFPT